MRQEPTWCAVENPVYELGVVVEGLRICVHEHAGRGAGGRQPGRDQAEVLEDLPPGNGVLHPRLRRGTRAGYGGRLKVR